LRELWRWRDAEAQSLDRPAFKVLRNEDLLNAASECEQGRHFELRHLRGRRREGFQEAIRLGLEVPESEWPQPPPKTPRPKPNPEFDSRLQKLRNARDRNAKDLKLDPSVIAPKAAMESIAGNPDRAAELLLPWQIGLLGIKG
jgi:ribonuclease D